MNGSIKEFIKELCIHSITINVWCLRHSKGIKELKDRMIFRYYILKSVYEATKYGVTEEEIEEAFRNGSKSFIY